MKSFVDKDTDITYLYHLKIRVTFKIWKLKIYLPRYEWTMKQMLIVIWTFKTVIHVSFHL